MGEMVNYEAEKLDLLSSVNEIVIQESKLCSFSFPFFPPVWFVPLCIVGLLILIIETEKKKETWPWKIGVDIKHWWMGKKKKQLWFPNAYLRHTLTWNSTKLKTSWRIMHLLYTIFHFPQIAYIKVRALLADPGDAIKISGPENGALMPLNNLITLIKLFSSVGACWSERELDILFRRVCCKLPNNLVWPVSLSWQDNGVSIYLFAFGSVWKKIDVLIQKYASLNRWRQLCDWARVFISIIINKQLNTWGWVGGESYKTT